MRFQGLFLVVVLCLTLALSWAYRAFEEHYSDRVELQKMVHHLEEKSERQDLKQALLKNQVEDLQAQVFQQLGKKKFLAWGERQWVASLRGPASESLIGTQSDLLLVEAKKYFSEKNYPQSIVSLEKLIEKYPASRDIVEAHFLLAEAHFVSGQVEASLDEIDKMMVHFPESELTGYIMLRMGQILEKKKRAAEAKEVYETVLRQYPKSTGLVGQAEKLLRAL